MLVPLRKSNQPCWVVEMMSRSCSSVNALLPTKLTPLTLVAPPSTIFEHDVHAALLELDDLRLDGRGKPALAGVDVENPLHVGLSTSARENGARLQLNFIAQRIGIDLAVAFESDLVDDRIFDDTNDDRAAVVVDGRRQRTDRSRTTPSASRRPCRHRRHRRR